MPRTAHLGVHHREASDRHPIIMCRTLAQLLCHGRAYLQDHSPTPALDARVLLRWAAGISDVQLITRAHSVPALFTAMRYQRALRRRRRGESVAAITREKEFFSHKFTISRAVLVPRPETELLVERALAHLAAHRAYHIAELGTGCGAVAISIAVARPHCRIIATDCSPRALATARINARHHHAHNIRLVRASSYARWSCTWPRPKLQRWRWSAPWPVQRRVTRAAWFAPLGDVQLDMIISNPPYLATSDPCLHADGVCYEPRLALVSGVDGLNALREIISDAPVHLKNGGRLLVEHGASHGMTVRALMTAAGLTNIHTHRDAVGYERVSEALLA